MSADEYWRRGNSFYEQEKYQEAAKEYEKALSVDLKNHRVWHILGLSYANSGDYNKAVECFQKAVELLPEYAEAWLSMGWAYENLGNYRKEIEYSQKALDINPEYSDAWYNMGVAHGKLGEYNKAVECYTKALEIHPGDVGAWNNLGWNFGKLGDHFQEIESYKKALRIDPNNGFARKSLEAALMKYPQYHEEKKEKGEKIADEAPTTPAKEVSPASGEQKIYCAECNEPIRIYLPLEVIAGKAQYQSIKKCPKCEAKISIAVLKSPDGSLSWQIGPSM